MLLEVFGPPPTPPKPVSNWTIEDARNFDQFPLHWLGESYQGLPLDSEYLEEKEIGRFDVLGVDGYVARYEHWQYLYVWSGRSAIFLATKIDSRIELAGRELIPITEDSGATPRTLPPPVGAPC